jgi:hypothetical protein
VETQLDRAVIGGELNRLAVALRDGERPECYREMYAAQQALAWALEPLRCASPYDSITGGTPATPVGCSDESRPPSS